MTDRSVVLAMVGGEAQWEQNRSLKGVLTKRQSSSRPRKLDVAPILVAFLVDWFQSLRLTTVSPGNRFLDHAH